MILEDVVAWNERLIVDNVENEIIVFNEETQKTHILNETAGYLFARLNYEKVKVVIDGFYDALTDEDKASNTKDDVTRDCIDLINEMLVQGLLVVTENV